MILLAGVLEGFSIALCIGVGCLDMPRAFALLAVPASLVGGLLLVVQIP